MKIGGVVVVIGLAVLYFVSKKGEKGADDDGTTPHEEGKNDGKSAEVVTDLDCE